ncbi:S1 RNA-binding domain-containing protein [Streptomyces zhihengii]
MTAVETQPHAQLAVGDSLEVLILRRRDPTGRCFVSHRQAVEHRRWHALREHYEQDRSVEGTVTEVVKGGLVLDIGVRAFLPASWSSGGACATSARTSA